MNNKINIRILFLFGGLISSLISRAYVPFINYDRIWEYSGGIWYYGRVIHKMKFIGESEINDKMYHAFGRIQTITLEFDSEIDEYVQVSNEVFEDNSRKYFVREEQGKLYSLIEMNKERNEELQYYSTKQSLNTNLSPSPGFEFSELLIYDENLENGDPLWLPVTTLDFSDPSIGLREYRQFYGDTILIDGVECRLMDIVPVSYADYYPSIENNYCAWIEGIGILSRGCLASFEIEKMNGMWYDSSEILTQNSILHSVYTTDGRLIYGEPPFTSVTTPSTDTLRIIVKDHILTLQGEGKIRASFYDLQGHEVRHIESSDEVVLRTDELAGDIFILKVTDETSTRTQKIHL